MMCIKNKNKVIECFTNTHAKKEYKQDINKIAI